MTLLVPVVGWAVDGGIGGNDANTKLLIHCDGADASTAFPDASASAHGVTAIGNAQVDTTQSRFGGASALFDGSGDYLSIPDHPDLEPGAGDFTVDFWMRPVSVSGDRQVACKRFSDGTYAPWNIGLSGNSLILYMSFTGSAWDIFASSFGTISVDSWYHVALARSGSTFYKFLNGTLAGTISTGSALYDNGAAVTFGGVSGTMVPDFNGWLDEIRFSKGVARWTSSFTPPDQPYS